MKTLKKSSAIFAMIALLLCVSFAITSCGPTEPPHECADANSDHICDGCQETLSQCADENKDHKCDLCNKAISKCVNENFDHDCDICGKALTECEDGNYDHYCDVCGNAVSECVDSNENHECDVCTKKLSSCADENKDHNCDLCAKTVSSCGDENKDHKCDVCDATLTECADADNDHKCDVCSASLSECTDADNNHACDLCAAVLSECVDSEGNDHKCDLCGATLTECNDADKNHNCDLCGTVLSQCADENKDHSCDICSATTECADADKNHNCDLCEKVLSECADTNNDHNCDVCGKALSECTDSAADDDHNCDLCGKNLCVDENKDHTCDVCLAVTVCADSDLNDKCDVCDKFLYNTIDFATGIESEYINGYIFLDGVYVRASEVDAATMNAATPTRFLYSKDAFKIRISPTMKETEKEGYVTLDLTNNKKEGNYYTFASRINHDAGTTALDVVRISFTDAEGNAVYSFVVTTATGAKMRLYGDAGLDVTTTIGRGSWFDVAAELCTEGENGYLKFYVDGVLAYEGVVAGAAGASINQIRIDSIISGGSKAFSIHFDDISFSKTAESVYTPAVSEE